jgi:hypothetical protein
MGKGTPYQKNISIIGNDLGRKSCPSSPSEDEDTSTQGDRKHNRPAQSCSSYSGVESGTDGGVCEMPSCGTLWNQGKQADPKAGFHHN